MALPALALILPLRPLTRGAARWLVALLCVGALLSVTAGGGLETVGVRYVFGQAMLGGWMLDFVPKDELRRGLAPAARAPEAPRTITFGGQAFALGPTPGAVLPSRGWWRLYLALVWRGSVALAAAWLAWASVRDRLRRPAFAVGNPQLDELVAGANCRSKGERAEGRTFPAGLRERALGASCRCSRAGPCGGAGRCGTPSSWAGTRRAGRWPWWAGKQREFHVLVAGMTGKGKTVFLCAVVVAAWTMGWGVVAVDLKGGATVRRLFHALAGMRRGVARVWTWNGPLSVDLLRGKPEEVAAMVVTIAGTVTGEQHNQESMGYLQWAVKTIDLAGAPRTFPLLQRLLAPAELEAVLKALAGERTKDPPAVAPRPLVAPPGWLRDGDPADEVRRLRAELATFDAREAVENLRAG